MSTIKRLSNGRYKANIESKRLGIARTRATFDTKTEAEAWLDAVKKDGTAGVFGLQKRRLFGEALIKYLREETPKKNSPADDISIARLLRWPFWNDETRRWCWPEDTLLEDIPAMLIKWSADLRNVERRRYVGAENYQLRAERTGAMAWYYQPTPTEGQKPTHRVKVEDPELIAKLAKPGGRGPFSSGTLRRRQALAQRILFMAWKYWSTKTDLWLKDNISERVLLDEKPLPRDQWLDDYNSLRALIIAAPIGFDAAILAAAWLGWRKGNLFSIKWVKNVLFPVYRETANGLEEMESGRIWVERKHVKNKKRPLIYPMVPHIEQLFKILWDSRNGEYVFHRNGGSFGDFRKMWKTTKKNAGIDPVFCWHSLRHTWTTQLLKNNVQPKHIAELQGWTSTKMVEDVYAHVKASHLVSAAELSKHN